MLSYPGLSPAPASHGPPTRSEGRQCDPIERTAGRGCGRLRSPHPRFSSPNPFAGRSKSGAAQRLQSSSGMWLFSLPWSSGTWQTWKPAGLSRALALWFQRDGAGMGAVPESSAPPLAFFLGIWFRCLSTRQECMLCLQKEYATVS